MSTDFLTHEALRARGINLSKCRLWQLEREGKFPARVRISAGRIAWLASEIDAYLAARVTGRTRAPLPASAQVAA